MCVLFTISLKALFMLRSLQSSLHCFKFLEDIVFLLAGVQNIGLTNLLYKQILAFF